MENQNLNEREEVSKDRNPESADSAANTNNSNSGSTDTPSGIRGGGTDLSAGPGALGVMGSGSSGKSSEGTTQGESQAEENAEKDPSTWPKDATLEEYLEKDKSLGDTAIKPGSLNRE